MSLPFGSFTDDVFFSLQGIACSGKCPGRAYIGYIVKFNSDEANCTSAINTTVSSDAASRPITTNIKQVSNLSVCEPNTNSCYRLDFPDWNDNIAKVGWRVNICSHIGNFACQPIYNCNNDPQWAWRWPNYYSKQPNNNNSSSSSEDCSSFFMYWMVGMPGETRPDNLFIFSKDPPLPVSTPNFVRDNMELLKNKFCQTPEKLKCDPDPIHLGYNQHDAGLGNSFVATGVGYPQTTLYSLNINNNIQYLSNYLSEFEIENQLNLENLINFNTLIGYHSSYYDLATPDGCKYNISFMKDTFELYIDVKKPAYIKVSDYTIPKYVWGGLNGDSLNLPGVLIKTPITAAAYCDNSRCWCPSLNEATSGIKLLPPYNSYPCPPSFITLPHYDSKNTKIPWEVKYKSLVKEYSKTELDNASWTINKECCSKNDTENYCCNTDYMNNLQSDICFKVNTEQRSLKLRSCDKNRSTWNNTPLYSSNNYLFLVDTINNKYDYIFNFKATVCPAVRPQSEKDTEEYNGIIQGLCDPIGIYRPGGGTQELGSDNACLNYLASCGNNCGKLEVKLADHNIVYTTEYLPPEIVDTQQVTVEYYYCLIEYEECDE